jgi:hypothetical protein
VRPSSRRYSIFWAAFEEAPLRKAKLLHHEETKRIKIFGKFHCPANSSGRVICHLSFVICHLLFVIAASAAKPNGKWQMTNGK